MLRGRQTGRSARRRSIADIAWLQECELFIAEVSGSSFGLRFENGYLLGATSKRVILLSRRDLERKVSLLITGNTQANCILVPYASVGEVQAFITCNLREDERRRATSV